jgi:hypothetical protein
VGNEEQPPGMNTDTPRMPSFHQTNSERPNFEDVIGGILVRKQKQKKHKGRPFEITETVNKMPIKSVISDACSVLDRAEPRLDIQESLHLDTER